MYCVTMHGDVAEKTSAGEDDQSADCWADDDDELDSLDFLSECSKQQADELEVLRRSIAHVAVASTVYLAVLASRFIDNHTGEFLSKERKSSVAVTHIVEILSHIRLKVDPLGFTGDCLGES